MKMKNIFKISILSLLLVSTAACTDDSKVLPIPPAGASVTFVPESKVIDFANLDTSAFAGVIDDTGGNVESFTISAYVEKADGTKTPESVLETITTFPYNLSYTGSFILSSLGLTVSEVGPGDIVKYSGIALTSDGRTFDASTVNGDAAGPGLLLAYSLSSPFFCEFSVADAVGQYTLTMGDWGDSDYTDYLTGYVENTSVTAVAGAEPNSIVFKDLLSPGFDLTVTVDPSTAIASVVDARVGASFGVGVYNSGAGYEGAILNSSGTPFYFSCTGSFKATYKVCVDVGCFATPVSITLQKN
jgi:hypothetical protein